MYRVWVRSFGGFRAGFERLSNEFVFFAFSNLYFVFLGLFLSRSAP